MRRTNSDMTTLFARLVASITKNTSRTVSDYVFVQIDPSATVSDACVSYVTIDSLNDQIYSLLQSITQETDFFSYYRLNLFNKQCPFWLSLESEGPNPFHMPNQKGMRC